MKKFANACLFIFVELASLWCICKCAPITYKRDFYVPHSITVCRGQMRSIACPNLELIHIYNAFYGKLSGHDCSSPVHQLRDQIPTCFSKMAPSTVKESCHGQQSCDLYAEDSMYDNPCPSVTKYLFVSFTCQGKSELNAKLQNLEKQKTLEFVNQALPAVQNFIQQRHELNNGVVSSNQKTGLISPSQTALVCTGQSRSIICPALQLLKIRTAFYGKQTHRDCSGQYTPEPTPTCYAHDTLNAVKDMCDGQQSCDLFAEPDLYGKSTCLPGTQKYLQVSFSCEGRSDLDKQLSIAGGGSYMPQLASKYFGRTGNNLPSNIKPDFVLRSSLPTSDYEHNNYYNQWKRWANSNEINQWRRTVSPYINNQEPTLSPTFKMDTRLSYLRSTFPNYDSFEQARQRGFAPQERGFIPQAQRGSVPQQRGFAPQQRGFAPQQRGFAPQQRGFAPQQRGFAPQQQDSIPQQRGFAPHQRGSIPQQRDFIPQDVFSTFATQQPQAPSLFNMDTPLSNLRSVFPDYSALERAQQRAQQRIELRTEIPSMSPQQPQQPQPQPMMSSPVLQQQPKQPSFDPMTYPILSSNFAQNPSKPCEQCNGDCKNYVCYGCGGCPVPPPEKQLYAYSYQKQDAGYHDSFEGHIMDLSGMVIFPVPPMPKPQPKAGGKPRPGKSDTPDDDDDDDNDVDDDDGDDDANFDDNDSDDVDESDDNSIDDDNKTKKSKTTKTKKRKTTRG